MFTLTDEEKIFWQKKKRQTGNTQASTHAVRQCNIQTGKKTDKQKT